MVRLEPINPYCVPTPARLRKSGIFLVQVNHQTDKDTNSHKATVRDDSTNDQGQGQSVQDFSAGHGSI